jgi:cell wall-associated NlpC family hydrolase
MIITRVPIAAELELAATRGDWVELNLPDGRTGFIRHHEARLVNRDVAQTIPLPDPKKLVDTAVRFIGTPYLWGGRTSLGVDCSGLVQLASEAAGLSCPRDADMQANEVGRQLDWQRADTLAHGDLVFWDGHVGIMTSAQDLVHASAYQMMVVEEPLAEARARIASSKGGEITGVRRPAGLSSAGLTSPR